MASARIRALVTAFAAVPSSSPHAAAVLGLRAALHADLDLVTVKMPEQAHLETLDGGRLMRVPVGDGTPAEQRGIFGRAVGRQLATEHYDVVHARGALEGEMAARRRIRGGFRFIYETASFPDEAEGPAAEASWNHAHRFCLEEADLILVPSDAAARGLGERGYAGKTAVIPPGVDVNTYDWWPSAPASPARLLYLGAFSADRDLDTLLRAVRRVRARMPLRMLVAGEPDEAARGRLRSMVEAFDVADIVTVRGEPGPEALSAIIAATDACVAPAAATPRYHEHGDVPQPLLEYFACRRPVIAAGVPGVAEVLRDEREGLLYTPGDETSLADAISTMLQDRQLAATYAEAAYRRARDVFSEGARRRRMAEVYEMLVPGSQSYDAWAAGFAEETTGQLLFELGGSFTGLVDKLVAEDLVRDTPRDPAERGADMVEGAGTAASPTDIAGLRAYEGTAALVGTAETDEPLLAEDTRTLPGAERPPRGRDEDLDDGLVDGSGTVIAALPGEDTDQREDLQAEPTQVEHLEESAVGRPIVVPGAAAGDDAREPRGDGERRDDGEPTTTEG